MSDPVNITPQWSAAVAAAARAQGHNLTAEAASALANSLGADPLNAFFAHFSDAPPPAVVAEAVKAAFAKAPPQASQIAGAYDSTCGLPPEVWAGLSAVNRLAKAREWEAQKAKTAPPPSQETNAPEFRIRRLKSELHGASLRLHSLRGAEREAQAKRILQLQSELKDAMKV